MFFLSDVFILSNATESILKWVEIHKYVAYIWRRCDHTTYHIPTYKCILYLIFPFLFYFECRNYSRHWILLVPMSDWRDGLGHGTLWHVWPIFRFSSQTQEDIESDAFVWLDMRNNSFYYFSTPMLCGSLPLLCFCNSQTFDSHILD